MPRLLITAFFKLLDIFFPNKIVHLDSAPPIPLFATFLLPLMQEHCFVSSFSWENVKTDKNITRNNGYTKFGGMNKVPKSRKIHDKLTATK